MQLKSSWNQQFVAISVIVEGRQSARTKPPTTDMTTNNQSQLRLDSGAPVNYVIPTYNLDVDRLVIQ